MNDAVLVCSFERLGDLTRNWNGLIERNLPLRDGIGERRPFDKLEDEGLRTVRILKAIDSSNIRVVEGSEELSFALEPCESIGIEREQVGQDLQGDVAIRSEERRV